MVADARSTLDVATFLDAYRELIAELDTNPFGFLPASRSSALEGWSAEARARLTPILETKDGSVIAILTNSPDDGSITVVWIDSEGSGPFALALSLAEFLSLLPYGMAIYDIASAVARYREAPALAVDPAERFASVHADRIVARAALAAGPPPAPPEDPDDDAAWADYMDARSAMSDGFVRALEWAGERAEVATRPDEVIARSDGAAAERIAWLTSQRTALID